MVVDDEPDIVFIFRKSLELAGYGVFAFTDPVAALEHLKIHSDRYSLVISDIRMPNMDGIEFAENVRKVANSIPIILMSAFDMSNLDIPEEVRIERLVQKPVTPLQLREIVSSYIALNAE